MTRAFGGGGRRLIAVGIAISTFGYCNIALIGSARVFQAMGADGAFFHAVARMTPRWHVPHRALLIVAGWAVALALSGHLQPAAGLLHGRRLAGLRRQPWPRCSGTAGTQAARPARYRTPLYPLTPLAFIATVLADRGDPGG